MEQCLELLASRAHYQLLHCSTVDWFSKNWIEGLCTRTPIKVTHRSGVHETLHICTQVAVAKSPEYLGLDNFALKNMSQCCITGHIHEGTPEGVESEFAGLRTYIATPPDGNKAKAVLFIHDIFGYELIVCLMEVCLTVELPLVG